MQRCVLKLRLPAAFSLGLPEIWRPDLTPPSGVGRPSIGIPTLLALRLRMESLADLLQPIEH
jgi:hypothetical protein